MADDGHPHCGAGALSALAPVALALAIGFAVVVAFSPAGMLVAGGGVAIGPLLGIGSVGMAILLFIFSLLFAPLFVFAGIVIVAILVGGSALMSLLRRIFPGLVSFIGGTLHTTGKAVAGLADAGDRFARDSEAIANMISGIQQCDVLRDEYWRHWPTIGDIDVGGIGSHLRAQLFTAQESLKSAKTDLDTILEKVRAAGSDLQSKGRDVDPTLP
jgi:hypothetical protein